MREWPVCGGVAYRVRWVVWGLALGGWELGQILEPCVPG